MDKKHPVAFIVMPNEIQNVALKNVWIVDSGASQHMTSRKEWFSVLSDSSSGKYVRVASGQRLVIRGHDSICASVWNGTSWKTCILENVQYVPGLAPNLFSTGTATSQGFIMVKKEHDCELRL